MSAITGARTLFSLSRFDAALRAYEKDVRPWRGKTLLGMALALDALNRDSDAENMYREAVASGDAFEDVTLVSGIAKASLPWTGWSNVIADFNNDGWKDLFSAGGHVMDNMECGTIVRAPIDAAQSSAHQRQNLLFGAHAVGRGAPPGAGVGRFRP